MKTKYENPLSIKLKDELTYCSNEFINQINKSGFKLIGFSMTYKEDLIFNLKFCFNFPEKKPAFLKTILKDKS